MEDKNIYPDSESSDRNVYPGATEEPSSMLRRGIGDPLSAVAKGAIIGIPETAVGLLDIPTMGYAGKGVDAALKAVTGGGFKEANAAWDEKFLSPETREAQRKVSEAKGFFPTIGAALENPSAIAQVVGQSLAPMGAGARLTALGMKAAGYGIKAGLTEANAAKALAAPEAVTGYKVGDTALQVLEKAERAQILGRAVVAGGVGEGLVTAGQNIEQVRQQTPDELLTPGQVGIGVASGALTGLIGVMGGKLAAKLDIFDFNTLMAGGRSGVVGNTEKGIFKKVLYGAIQEGILEELPQSMQEQIAQNLSLGKPIGDDVLEQGAMGMLAGFAQSTGAQIGGTVLQKMRIAESPLTKEINKQMSELPDENAAVTPVSYGGIGGMHQEVEGGAVTGKAKLPPPIDYGGIGGIQGAGTGTEALGGLGAGKPPPVSTITPRAQSIFERLYAGADANTGDPNLDRVINEAHAKEPIGHPTEVQAILDVYDARKKADEEAEVETRKVAAAEETRKAEEAARLKAEEDTRLKAEEEARIKAEEEKKKLEEEKPPGETGPAKRSWYDFKELDPNEWTPEEESRMLEGKGPTPEETKAWNDIQRGDTEAKAQAERAKKAAEAEIRKKDIVERVSKSRRENYPEITIPDVASRIKRMGGDRNRVMTASEFSKELSQNLGIPEKHQYLAKIMDKLGVKVTLSNEAYVEETPTQKGSAPAYYSLKNHMVTIAHNTLTRAVDHGRGYAAAWAEESMVHEFVHAIVRESGAWKTAEPKLKAFWYELLKHKPSAPKEIQHYFEHIEKHDVDEMVSMAFSEATFAQWLDSIPATGVKNPSKTLWGKLKDIILGAMRTFGLPKSKLDELNELLDNVIATAEMEKGVGEKQEEIEPPKKNVPTSAIYGPLDNPDTVKLSKLFQSRMGSGVATNKNIIKDLIAREYGLTTAQITEYEKQGIYNHKAIEEAYEYATVKWARDYINSGGSPNLQELIKRYVSQANMSSRTSDSTMLQQYSTPLPIAWMMNKWLNMTGRKINLTVYEPTAGNGMLLIGANPELVSANELDKGARLANLKDFLSPGEGGMRQVQSAGYGTITNENALSEGASPKDGSQDRVIMNPPFGKAAVMNFGGYLLEKLEHQIVAVALKTMKNDGKAAFIIGGHNFRQEARMPSGELISSVNKMSGADKVFLNFLYNNYNVINNIDVNGDLYGRQGTTFPIRLITIQGRRAEPATGIADYTGIQAANTFEDISNILERKVADETGQKPEGTVGTGQRKPASGDTGLPEGGGTPGRGPESAGGAGVRTGGGERGDSEGKPGEGYGGGEPGGKTGEVRGGNLPAEGDERAKGTEGPSGAVGQDRGPGVLTDKEKSMEELKKAIEDLDLDAPIQRMAFETEKEENNYTKLKPSLEKSVTDTINEAGGEDVSMVDILRDLKENLGALFDKATKYVMRYLKEELRLLKERIRDAVIFQVKYIPRSTGPTDGTVAPRNQADAQQRALDRIVDLHGPIDEYVMNQYEYGSVKELHDAVGAEQVDALAMVADTFSNNAGFILGDQTGVGKGRVVGGAIKLGNLQGKIPIFVTANPGLFSDMVRDLKAIGHPHKPFIMHNSGADIYNKDTNELLLETNSKMAKGPAVGQSRQKMKDGLPVTKNGKPVMESYTNWEMIARDPLKYMTENGFTCIFTTYSQHNLATTKLQDRVISGLGEDNYFLLDESHKAAGDSAGGTSNTFDKFTEFLKPAKAVLYSSATYAKTPHNNAIYFRTALGGTGMQMHELVAAIIAGGNPLQEYLSSALTGMGQMTRRELDWNGIEFLFTDTMQNMKESDNPARYADLRRMFDRDKKQADGTNKVIRPMVRLSSELHSKTPVKRAALVRLLALKGIQDHGPGGARMNPSSAGFSSVVHNFSSQLLVSIKADRAIEEAKKAIDEGRKPIINLMNTMGSFMEDVVKNQNLQEGDKIEFTYKGVMDKALKNTLRMKGRDAFGQPFIGEDGKEGIVLTPEELRDHLPWAYQEYQDTMYAMERYDGSGLHASPIDYIKHELEKYSGKPVGEITGRTLTIDYSKPGDEKTLKKRKDTNRAQTIFDFNYGNSTALIVNAAGAEGISLHPSPTVNDKSPRRMLFLQPHHDVSVFIQTGGRIFRKGMVVKPEYRYITSDLPAEIRPAVILQRKLASLKANTTSKQAGAETRTDVPDMMNDYGNEVTRNYLESHKSLAQQINLIHSVRDNIPPGVTYQDVSGKITILSVETQKEFYGEIEQDYHAYIQELDEKGENKLISKNYDLRAKNLRTNTLFLGADPSNPLTSNVNAELMEVRVLRQVHNKAKILSMVNESLGLVTVGEAREEISEKIGEFLNWADREKAGEPLTMKVGEQRTADQYNDILKKRVDAARDEYIRVWSRTLEEKFPGDQQKQQSATRAKQAALDNEVRIYREVLNKFKIGDTYTFPYGLNADPQQNLMGVLTKILWEKPADGVNPLQLARLRFVFSVSDPLQTRIFNASQSWFTGFLSDHTQSGIPEDWDQIIPKGRTEQRAIITGNMIRAINIAQSQNPELSAEMIYFSRDDGSKEFGLLVSRTDQERVMGIQQGAQGRQVGWKDAHDYLVDRSALSERFVSSMNGQITIQGNFTENEDGTVTTDFTIGTPASQQIGGKYFQDPDLLKYVRNNNFHKYSGRMLAHVDRGNLKDFMEVLHTKHQMQFLIPLTQAPPTRALNAATSGALTKYYTNLNGDLREVIGKDATIPGWEWMRTFLIKNQFKEWRIVERTTGQYIGQSNKTQDKAIRSAERFMSNRTRAEMEELLKSYIARHGGTPYNDALTQPMPFKEAPIEGKGEPTYAEKVQSSRMIYLQGSMDKAIAAQQSATKGSAEWNGLEERRQQIGRVMAKVSGVTEEQQNMPFVPAIPWVNDLTDRFLNKPQEIPAEVLKEIKSIARSQNDFQFKDEYFGLPWRNAKKYPAWRKAFDIFGIQRPESRGAHMHSFAEIAEPFFKLDENMRKAGKSKKERADSHDRITRVIITGDALLGPQLKALRQQIRTMEPGAEKDRISARIAQIERDNRYSDQQLLDGIRDDQGQKLKLSQEEIEVYKSVRNSLDFMFDTYVDHLQTQTFRRYKNQKWYAILAQAAGMDLGKTSTLRIVGAGLNQAALLRAVKIQPDINKIFDRVERAITQTPDAEKMAAGELYGRISDKLSEQLLSLEKALSTLTGEKDPKKLTEMTRAILSAYMFTRPQLKLIKALRNTYKKQVAFFPRVREQGKYKARLFEQIKDKEGMVIKERELHSEMFTTEAQGREIYNKMLQRWGKDGVLPDSFHATFDPATTTPEFAFQGVNDINMQKVYDDAIESMKGKGQTIINKKGEKIDVSEQLRQAGHLAIAKQFQSRGFGRHMTHRQWNVIKGYEENNLQRVLFNYMGGMAGIMTKQVAASDFLEMMKDVKEPELFKSLAKYGKDQLRNETKADKFSSRVRAFMFTWYLGGVLRPAVLQFTQNFVTGIPKHAQYLRENNLGGAGEADKDYLKSMKDVAFKNYTKSGTMVDPKTGKTVNIEQRMQDQLFTEGVTVDQYLREIMGSMGSRFSQGGMRVINFLAYPFSRMEQFNRQSAALTRFRPAYKLALKEGLSEEEAYEKAFGSARDYVYDTHYAYGKANLPQLAQGEGVGVAVKTLYTFKSFTHNYCLAMYDDMAKGDWKTWMHSLAYLAMFGGLMGLPFFKDLFEFIEKHFGFNFSGSIRKTLNSAGGKTLETFGMNGIPAMLGMNMSGSLAIGVPFMGETPQDSVYGVYGGQYQKMKRAGEAATRGDWYRTAANLAPEVMRGPIVAAEESKAGKELFGTPGVATTTRGRPVYDEEGKPLSMGTGEAIAKTFGFQPTEFARQKEKEQTVRRQEAWAAEQKTDAAETYRIARLNNKPDALKNMMNSVKEINEGIRSRGIEKLVPMATVSKIIESSRQSKTKQQQRELRYKQGL
jgi:hypothetical protein